MWFSQVKQTSCRGSPELPRKLQDDTSRRLEAQETAEDGRGTGYLVISSGSCHDELRSTTFYEPHDITHRQAGP
jgi:hypothetical protein